MKHILPELPYALDALKPRISAETLEYHHGKHHRAYVNKLNDLIQGTPYEEMSLEKIVMQSEGPIFNQAAQAWNHSFFWNCMTPEKNDLTGALAQAIDRDFGSKDGFLSQFKKAGTEVFGSGWVWLVKDDALGKLRIEKTSNAQTPLAIGRAPILTCDVWEHAYYIDYRNDRSRFIDAVIELLNWEFAGYQYQGSKKELAA